MNKMNHEKIIKTILLSVPQIIRLKAVKNNIKNRLNNSITIETINKKFGIERLLFSGQAGPNVERPN